MRDKCLMLFIVEVVGVMLPCVVGSSFAAFVLLAEKLFRVRFCVISNDCLLQCARIAHVNQIT